jgi:signal transduction histidine kinase
MKIRNKIVLTFTAMVSFVLLISFSLVYYLSSRYIESDFYDRVHEKATLTAWKYYEKDEMSELLYKKVIDKGVMVLPDASEIVLDAGFKNQVADSLNKILPENLVRDLLAGKNIKFRNHDQQSIGLFYPDNQGNFIILITAVNKIGIQEQKKLLELLVLIFSGCIIFIFLLGKLYATNVLYPIANILKNVKRIRATNLSLRLQENSRNDELSELTRTFNQMLDRLENAFTLQKNFIHNSSHELKNPLTAILGEVEIALSRTRTPDEYVTTLQKVMSEAERLDLLTQNLLSLAQTESDPSGIKREEIRLDEFVWEIKEHFDRTNYQGRIEIHYPVLPETSDRITILGIPFLLKIAIINIIDNACKFSDPHIVNITLESGTGGIHLQISDNGIGIPESERNSLFQPFFRASNAMKYKGSGIGLSLVHRIITLHSGTIRITSAIGKGTAVDLEFPVA